MYSQQWSLVPSTTAVAPELRHGETLTGGPRHEQRPTRSAVQAGVSGAMGVLSSGDARAHHNRPSAHALADIVVGRAVEHDRHTIDQKTHRGSVRLLRTGAVGPSLPGALRLHTSRQWHRTAWCRPHGHDCRSGRRDRAEIVAVPPRELAPPVLRSAVSAGTRGSGDPHAAVHLRASRRSPMPADSAHQRRRAGRLCPRSHRRSSPPSPPDGGARRWRDA